MIVIVNLTLKNNDSIKEIIISNKNKILFQYKEDLMEFFKYFYNIFDTNCLDTKIYINNSVINIKEYVFLNLFDINAILYNLKYIKGTLFYEYFNIKINDLSIKNQLSLEKNINKINDKLVKDNNLNILYNNNSVSEKIFGSVIKYSLYPSDNICNDVYYMLKKVVNYNCYKKYIIFYDSKILKININNGNIYFFDINQSLYFNKYNILLINKDIVNFNSNILINSINNICPIGKIRNIDQYLNKYFLCYFKNDNIFLTEQNEILIFSIINKLYNMNKRMNFKIKINNIIKSYINI